MVLRPIWTLTVPQGMGVRMFATQTRKGIHHENSKCNSMAVVLCSLEGILNISERRDQMFSAKAILWL
ncbi:MAG: hypothetical protein DMG05_29840 [Acidobacteria bacterium]|nr:MAG: hypothetical protein DMG05_29840 [Acidobacteriota bacterium]